MTHEGAREAMTRWRQTKAVQVGSNGLGFMKGTHVMKEEDNLGTSLEINQMHAIV